MMNEIESGRRGEEGEEGGGGTGEALLINILN